VRETTRRRREEEGSWMKKLLERIACSGSDAYSQVVFAMTVSDRKC